MLKNKLSFEFDYATIQIEVSLSKISLHTAIDLYWPNKRLLTGICKGNESALVTFSDVKAKQATLKLKKTLTNSDRFPFYGDILSEPCTYVSDSEVEYLLLQLLLKHFM